MLGTAVEDELIARNPCVLKRASVERHEERPVASVEQIAALADAIEPRYRAMLLLASWCSLRFGELAGLVRSYIDLSTRVVSVSRQLQDLQEGRRVFGPPKTEAGQRTVAIPPHVLGDIKAHLDTYVETIRQSLVFVTPEGTPLRRSNLNRRVWQPASATVGVSGFRFHDLRQSGNKLAVRGRQPEGTHAPDGPRQPAGGADLPARDDSAGPRRRRCSIGIGRTEPALAEPNLQLVTRKKRDSRPEQTPTDGSGCGIDVGMGPPSGLPRTLSSR